MASESPAITTAQVGPWTVQTNRPGETPESIIERHTPKPEGAEDAPEPTEEEKASAAASELGKLGGKAAAKAKAKAAKEAAKEAKNAEAESEAKAAPESDETEAESEPEPEKPLGKPRDDPRARMLEATRKESEAKKALAEERERHSREMEEIRAEIRSLREARETRERPEESAPERPKELKKPTPEEFDDYEKYLDARDDFNRRQWTEENEKRSRHAEVNKALQSAHEKFKTAIEDVWETIKPTVGRLNPTFNLPPGAQETGGNWIANFLFFNPESARSLALHLHEHPDELQRLSTLTSPHAVSRELGRIEARIEAATTDTSVEVEPKVPKAAPPVKPVSGAPYVASGSEEYRKGMTLDEYARKWKPAKR